MSEFAIKILLLQSTFANIRHLQDSSSSYQSLYIFKKSSTRRGQFSNSSLLPTCQITLANPNPPGAATNVDLTISRNKLIIEAGTTQSIQPCFVQYANTLTVQCVKREVGN